jgi:anthranilate phosphoribosyltransferase
VAELKSGPGGGARIEEYLLDPRELGIQLVPPSALRGGSARENALVARGVLAGRGTERAFTQRPAGDGSADRAGLADSGSAVAAASCLNAGAALYLYGLAPTIGEGYAMAKRSVESGAAREKLDAIVAEGRRIAAEARETKGACVP